MTYSEITQMLGLTGCPYAYDHFPNNIAPNPPYIVFNFPESNDFGADNKNYVSIDTINIELYVKPANLFEEQQTVEAILDDYGFFYEKNEAYITKEDLYQISYVSQVITE